MYELTGIYSIIYEAMNHPHKLRRINRPYYFFQIMRREDFDL